MNKSAMISAIALAAGSALAQPAIQSFVGTPTGISADGQFVCGNSTSNQAFRWSQSTGVQLLLPVAPLATGASAVANDGRVAGVYTYLQTIMGQNYATYVPVRWSAAGVMEEFPVPFTTNAPPKGGRTHGISASGSLVAGSATNPNDSSRWLPVLWTPAIQYLTLPPGFANGEVVAVSGDGSALVGYYYSLGLDNRPFRWSSSKGVVTLPTLPGTISSGAWGVSFNGSVIVGSGNTSPNEFIPVRWDGTTITPLPFLPGFPTRGRATAVSDNGAVIVGIAGSAGFPPPPVPVLWTAAGVERLDAYFIARGLDLTGWSLSSVVGVSRDGRVFAGAGTHSGSPLGWVVTLPVCYANCDGSAAVPLLNVNDFICFLNKYAAGDSYANCDNSTIAPILNVNDFTCFVNGYAAGCP